MLSGSLQIDPRLSRKRPPKGLDLVDHTGRHIPPGKRGRGATAREIGQFWLRGINCARQLETAR